MVSNDLLVMGIALPPMWLAAKLWWSARHAVDELRQYRVVVPMGEQGAWDARDRLHGGAPAWRCD